MDLVEGTAIASAITILGYFWKSNYQLLPNHGAV